MTSRNRDEGRRYDSGAEKLRKRKLREEFRGSQKGALEKYLRTGSSQLLQEKEEAEAGSVSVTGENSESKLPTEQEVPLEDNDKADDLLMKLAPCLSSTPTQGGKENSPPPSPEVEQTLEAGSLPPFANFEDPGLWPHRIDDATRNFLVERGPPEIPTRVTFPRSEEVRHFSKDFCRHKLVNGEINVRSWLIYSKSKDVAFFFCCRLFNVQTPHTSKLCKPDGFNKWKHAAEALRQHERSREHILSFEKWVELRQRLAKQCTIDAQNEALINQEKKHWQDVLTRIIAGVQYLAETRHFEALQALYKRDNGNFLKLMEVIATFDAPMKEHMRRIRDKNTQFYCLGPEIQNEIIEMLGTATKERILDAVRSAKYYAVILDCTPDKSHQEQMNLILRYVDMTDTPAVVEKFIQFLQVGDSTGEGLTKVLKNTFSANNLDIMDCRGQGYDNEANMKRKYKGVQARVLKINKRPMFTPCAAHSLNLVLGDMAKCCKEAMTFFGILQRLYNLFSASTERWSILTKHCPDLTLKPLSTTRWESRVESVKAVRFQLKNICGALQDVAETTKDPVARSEALSLSNHSVSSFEFVLALVIWYDLLHAANAVSKTLHAEDMQLDVALQQISGLVDFFEKYRETGFTSAMVMAKGIVEDLGWDARFCLRRQKKPKHFFEEKKDDTNSAVDADEREKQHQAEKRFRIEYFLPVVDEGLSCIRSKFSELRAYDEYFGFLFNPSKLFKMEDEEIEEHYKKLANYLQDDQLADVDASDLVSEVKLFRRTIPSTVKTALGALKHLGPVKESYASVTTAYRILLTIPVTVASGERSFSKLKLIKNYLRSTMSQERLNGLAILSIEREEALQLSTQRMIRDFASRKARRVSFL